MSHTIIVIDRTRRVRRAGFLKSAIEALLEAEDQPPSLVEILITDADGIRELNRGFRGIDRPTDVLSFPAGNGPEASHILGEVAICLPIAEEQAQTRGVTLEAELACLAIHGCQHLLGYDDDSEKSRAEMIRRMNAIAASLGHQVVEDWGSVYARN
jgi:probable rRNA maturation factor